MLRLAASRSVSFRLVFCSLFALHTLVLAAVVAPRAAAGAQVRLSTAGGLGDLAYGADQSAGAFNPTRNEFLVAWRASDDQDGMVKGEWEIFARRVSASTGLPIGPQFRVTEFGPPADTEYWASHPALAYNPALDQYLLVFLGNYPDDAEIYGMVLDGAGQPLTRWAALSEMGAYGVANRRAHAPAVVYNPTWHEYYVVWAGSDDVGGRAPGELEIYGQRVTEQGVEVGDDILISNMGPVGDPDFGASSPRLVYNGVWDQYFVVWAADDDVGGQIDNEYEIYAQQLHGHFGTPLLGGQRRLSTVGGLGTLEVRATGPTVAFDPDDMEYMVTWRTCFYGIGCKPGGQRVDATSGLEIGLDDMLLYDEIMLSAPRIVYSSAENQYLYVGVLRDEEPPAGVDSEVYSFYLATDGSPVGDPVRQSLMGLGEPGYFGPEDPEVLIDPSTGAFLTIWSGPHDQDGQVEDEYEVFSQLFAPSIFSDGFESGDTSRWSN